MTKLQFKFREEAAPKARRRLIQALDRNGARKVRRLFPNESDAALAGLYVADVSDAAAARLLKLLQGSKDVEFAEGEIRRKLIR
ncbi:MAG: hypothetical protein HYY76_12730 [Acidobacteria bacterium]|nr:hypothetical protein [Acidobacteriota bacterium]